MTLGSGSFPRSPSTIKSISLLKISLIFSIFVIGSSLLLFALVDMIGFLKLLQILTTVACADTLIAIFYYLFHTTIGDKHLKPVIAM